MKSIMNRKFSRQLKSKVQWRITNQWQRIQAQLLTLIPIWDLTIQLWTRSNKTAKKILICNRYKCNYFKIKNLSSFIQHYHYSMHKISKAQIVLKIYKFSNLKCSKINLIKSSRMTKKSQNSITTKVWLSIALFRKKIYDRVTRISISPSLSIVKLKAKKKLKLTTRNWMITIKRYWNS